MRREAIERPQPAAEVVGGDEIGEVTPELIVVLDGKRLTVVSFIVPFIRLTLPLVHGGFGLVVRCSIPAQRGALEGFGLEVAHGKGDSTVPGQVSRGRSRMVAAHRCS